ncbi:MAG: hypothetical protein ACOC1F_11935 [Myxococcota bacterium]
MRPDEAREAIVRRRARFIAAALASSGVALSAQAQDAGSVEPQSDAAADAAEVEPEVCLCTCDTAVLGPSLGWTPLAAVAVAAVARKLAGRRPVRDKDKRKPT